MTLTTYPLRAWSWIVQHKILSSAALLLLVGGGYWYVQSQKPTAYQYVTVTRGPITETVSVTGSTEAVQSVSLAFQNAGTVSRVFARVGDHVSAGQILASLNTASLSAALLEAEAAYASAVASRSSTSLPETTMSAQNAYRSAYTTLDTVLQDSVDLFYGEPTSYGPKLLINAPTFNYGELSQLRAKVGDDVEVYGATLGRIDTEEPLVLLGRATDLAEEMSDFLNKLAIAANGRDSGASATQLAALSSARVSVSTLLTTLSTARGTYRSGSANATAIADATVAQAAARVAAAKANIANAQIVAPISGVVTQFDAKVGQTASPSTPLISLISDGDFEITAGVPETDIGKVSVGNSVTLTLDAFPGDTFTGRVYYIDPAETITSGVVDYKIKVSFNKADPRMKSGLTANLDIATRNAENALILPQYAVLQNDAGTFIKVLRDGVEVELPVVLGMQDQEGNVEIRSGVSEGDQVLNIGLKP